jgi:hypothetical protein
MPTDSKELICVRCGLEVRVNRESYEIFERMHYVCFHFEFEHMGFDPDQECDAPGCPSSPFNSPPTHSEAVLRRDRRDRDGTALPGSSEPAAPPCGLLAPDPAFQKLDTAELLAMVPCDAESVLRRGRAVMELGRRAADNPPLLTEVAALIRDPANRRLITGPVSVSQLGTAGLVAADAEPTTALARELAAEWPPAGQSDFARLMTDSGIAWPPSD